MDSPWVTHDVFLVDNGFPAGTPWVERMGSPWVVHGWPLGFCLAPWVAHE